MLAAAMGSVPLTQFASVVDELRLAIFIFHRDRLQYQNKAANALVERLRQEYGIELSVTLRDHIIGLRDHLETASRAVTLLTAAHGEPFYVHVMPLRVPKRDDRPIAVSVREIGMERDAFRRRYRLSRREAQVVELVLRGYGNRDIAAALGMAVTTTKKHLTRIFDKVGVDTRSQLISRLA